jgi:hypothetical protein
VSDHNSGNNPRIQILINNKLFSTVAIESLGALSVGLNWTTQNPHVKSTNNFENKVCLTTHGSYWQTDELVSWGIRVLKTGDEVTFRVLAAGDFDQPIERHKVDRRRAPS